MGSEEVPNATPRRFRTRQLDADVDLLGFAGQDGLFWRGEGLALAGRGVAATIPASLADPAITAERVHQVLGTASVDDEVGRFGTGPVVMGALPFRRGEPGVMIVPEVVVGEGDDGTRWVTTTGDSYPDLDVAPDEHEDPVSFTIDAERDPGEWCDAVECARQELAAEGYRKAVLARAVKVTADRPLSRLRILRALADSFPSCMLFAVDGFVGASPELLVSRRGDRIRSRPMAGTAPRAADPEGDARLAEALLGSGKDREEHQITIDMVHDTLLRWCSFLDWEPEPSIAAVANVQHLSTLMEGQLSTPPPSVLEMVAALHPTPAVGGEPRTAALELIDRLELLDRARYAGPVGWVDAEGNGDWAVGIRSAELEGCTARLFAGVGVVPDSDPAAELAETRAKLQALLSAVVRP